MRVLLAGGFAFQSLTDGLGGRLELRVEDIAGGARAAVAGVHQLDRAHRAHQGRGGELEEVIAALKLALLKAQAIALQAPEDLFDTPYKMPLIT